MSATLSNGQALVAIYTGAILFCAAFGAIGILAHRLLRTNRRVDAWRDVLLGFMAEWRQKEKETALRERAESSLRAHWARLEPEDGCSPPNIYLRGVRRP